MFTDGVARVRRATETGRQLWAVVFIGVACLYAVTAHWWGINNADSVAAAFSGFHFAREGTFFLDGAALPDTPWFFTSGEHVVNNRTAGVILIGVPLQAALAGFDVHFLTPAVLTAVLCTSVAMANIALLLFRMGFGRRMAVAATMLLALGTGFWSNASGELWTHGPDAMWLSLALLAVERERHWLAGLALAPAIMTRPHLAVAAAALGLMISASRRSVWPAVRIGVPCVAGLGTLLAWNAATFGAPSVGGGYSYPSARLADTSASAWEATALSAVGSLVSPLRGLLVLSPFVLLAVVAACRALPTAASWVRGAALGGVLYQAVQWRLNGFTGGEGFFSYRLPLELLVLAAPLACLGYAQWKHSAAWVPPAMRVLGGVAVATHAVGVFWWTPTLGTAQILHPWQTYGPLHVATTHGAVGESLAGVAALMIIAVHLAAGRKRGSAPTAVTAGVHPGVTTFWAA